MLKIKRDINEQDFKTVDLHFVQFLSTWSCVSRQRDTTSSWWKFKLNNLALKWFRPLTLVKHVRRWIPKYICTKTQNANSFYWRSYTANVLSPWSRKGVSATWLSGRYTLSFPMIYIKSLLNTGHLISLNQAGCIFTTKICQQNTLLSPNQNSTVPPILYVKMEKLPGISLSRVCHRTWRHSPRLDKGWPTVIDDGPAASIYMESLRNISLKYLKIKIF